MAHAVKLLDAITANRTTIQNVSRELEDLIDAFDLTGNTKVADILDGIKRRLVIQEDALYKAHGEHLSGNLNDSELQTGNMIMSILTGFVKEV